MGANWPLERARAETGAALISGVLSASGEGREIAETSSATVRVVTRQTGIHTSGRANCCCHNNERAQFRSLGARMWGAAESVGPAAGPTARLGGGGWAPSAASRVTISGGQSIALSVESISRLARAASSPRYSVVFVVRWRAGAQQKGQTYQPLVVDFCLDGHCLFARHSALVRVHPWAVALGCSGASWWLLVLLGGRRGARVAAWRSRRAVC